MNRRYACTFFILLVGLHLAGTFAPAIGRAAEPLLKSGDFVAVIGDSITEQKQYSVYIENYLLMCQPVDKTRVLQFGWSGETAEVFDRRMENDVFRFHPTVATTCYGMNDGGYSPMNPDKAKRYRDAQTRVVQKFKKAGVRTIVVGSPGAVDSDTFRNDPSLATMYNKTLGEEREIARDVAKAEAVVFADVYGPMIDVMAKAKAKYGNTYPVAGGDGVHPGPNGHLIMAYAFLKALGCSGEIGKISVDLSSDKATASDGHRVLSCKAGTVELESTRYPFCFNGEPNSPNATTGIIEFLPFNEELNRLMLTVQGGKSDNYNVTWGKNTVKFSAKQLADGVNLAAAFLDNPFSQPFAAVEKKIRDQQNFETPLIKSLVTKEPELKLVVPDDVPQLGQLIAHAVQRDETLAKASSAAIEPVKHTIKIEPAK